MTANEMADALELKLDRSDSFGSPGYEDFELSSVLTEAEQLYVKKYFDELPLLLDSYNKSYHRSIKNKPYKISKKNEDITFYNL